MKYKPSAFFQKVRSLLFDLSYFPNLALTLMSAHIRGGRARVRSYMGHRGSEKKSERLILNDIQKVKMEKTRYTALVSTCSYSSKS